MKRLLTLLAALACLAALLVGCDQTWGDDSSQPPASTGSTSPTSTAPTEPQLPEYQPGSIKLAPVDAYFSFERPYRFCYYYMDFSFHTLRYGEDVFGWLKELSAQTNNSETRHEMLLVSYIKHFNISREEFDQTVEKIRNEYVLAGYDLEKEEWEIPNGDIIYTFDNEVINRYYRYEPSQAPATDPAELPEYIPGSIVRNFWEVDLPRRHCYYSLKVFFLELLDEEEKQGLDAWLREYSDRRDQPDYDDDTDEMLMVRFIKRYNITREEFDQTVALMREEYMYTGRHPALEEYELPNGDIIYTFDNEIINYYYRYE